MGKTIIGIILGLLLVAVNGFAANGDLIVDGNLGVGTASPSFTVEAVGPDSASTYMGLTDYSSSTPGNSPNLVLSRARGTRTMPTAIMANDTIGQFTIRGYTSNHDGTGGAWDSARGVFRVFASENWWSDAPIGGGIYSAFYTRPNGSNGTLYERMRIDPSGNVGIGTTSPTSSLEVVKNVTGNFSALHVYNNAGSPYNNTDSVSISLGRANIKPMGQITGSNQFTGSFGEGYLAFSTRSSEAMIERIRISNIGYVGIGTTTPDYPLDMASGAHVTTGGVWTNASSRAYKDNIAELSASQALAAVRELNPVTFAYKVDATDKHVGFIAEDVPELVATPDRKSLSAMDIVAVLTKVVQEQQKVFENQKETIKNLSEKVSRLERMLTDLSIKNVVSGVYTR